MKKIAYFGVDYHSSVLAIAVMIEGSKEIHDTIRIKNDPRAIHKYFKRYSSDYKIKACYEASCSGYVFQRKMQSWGYHCDVVAPSLIPKKPGDRRKNDFRDATNLVRNYAAGMLSLVHLPTEEEEGVRGLVRCRTRFKEDEKAVKQQINSLLLSQGFRWSKSKWTDKHLQWISKLEISNKHVKIVLEEHLNHLAYIQSRRHYLEEQIEKLARSETYAESVKKLRAFKGIATIGAMVLICELTDFRRFPNPGALMAFLGLIPSENSSGDSRKGGGITKAGNHRCRNLLIESVQHYVRRPVIGSQMKKDLAEVDAHSASIAVKCLKRLHKRFWHLTMKGKLRCVAITAIAREMVGFIWAMMQPNEVVYQN
jgi:transposase